eukprot:scaffold130384_cov15-Tisochrysis_lutea.AAC.1
MATLATALASAVLALLFLCVASPVCIAYLLSAPRKALAAHATALALLTFPVACRLSYSIYSTTLFLSSLTAPRQALAAHATAIPPPDASTPGLPRPLAPGPHFSLGCVEALQQMVDLVEVCLPGSDLHTLLSAQLAQQVCGGGG